MKPTLFHPESYERMFDIVIMMREEDASPAEKRKERESQLEWEPSAKFPANFEPVQMPGSHFVI